MHEAPAPSASAQNLLDYRSRVPHVAFGRGTEAHLQSLSELEHKIQAIGSVGSCGQWSFNPKCFHVTQD
jgi:hypothetical protein